MAWIIRSDRGELTESEVADQVGGFFTAEKVDHKCQLCLSRIIVDETDKADCTKVEGGISLGRGTCNLWKSGEASTEADIVDSRLTYEESGYIETADAGFQIICGTCERYEQMDEKHGMCKLFMKKVDAPYCCAGYKNSKVGQPSQ